MRLLICFLFAAAAFQFQVHGQTAAPLGSYAAELPHGGAARFVFSASIGEFTATNGPVKMQLVGRDLELQDDTITLRVLARKPNSRVIRADFPFGGHYVGRYNANRNVIVGHFGGFALRGKPSIPRGTFEMSPLPAAASSPAN